MTTNSIVSIAEYSDSVEHTIRKAIDLLGGIHNFVGKGDRVIIKPNLAFPYPPPVVTDPRIIEAVVKLCFEAGAREVGIGDSSSYAFKHILGTGRWTNQEVIEQTGIEEVAARCGAKAIDFDEASWRKVKIPDGIILNKVEIASAVLDADVVINIPVMKTHFETLVTLGIKNYHGIISDCYKAQYHRTEISQKLVDLHKIVKTDLTIMDGLVAMEGLGPGWGDSVKMNLILASADVVALDAVTSEVMGIRADEVETTRLAAMQGIGNGNLATIDVVGHSIEDVKHPFARPDIRITGIFPKITVIKGGPCVHCQCRGRTFLETLKDSGIFGKDGVSTLLIGVKPKNPDVDDIEGDVVFFGNCAIEASTNLIYALGKRAWVMEGCPPMPALHRTIEGLQQKFHVRKGKQL